MRDPPDDEAWPARVAPGATVGLAAYLLLTGGDDWRCTEDPLRISGAAQAAISGRRAVGAGI